MLLRQVECGCLSSRPSGVSVYLLFPHFFPFFCELGRRIFSEVDSGLKLDFFNASLLPSLSLSFPICKSERRVV